MTTTTTPIERRDTPHGRFYLIDGESLPSVTTILNVIGKPGLLNWAASTERQLVIDTAADLYLDVGKTPLMSRPAYVSTLTTRLGTTRAHKRELEKAGSIGTQAHKRIEWHLRQALGQVTGPMPPITDEALWAFMAFEDWAKSVDLKPRLIEQVVYSKTYGYAGTMDLLADVEGVPRLVDFKTGKAIYGEALLQSAAYQTALVEMGHPAPQGGLVVRIPKNLRDPAFEVAEVPPVAELLPVFLAARRLFVWQDAQDRAYWATRKSGLQTEGR